MFTNNQIQKIRQDAIDAFAASRVHYGRAQGIVDGVEYIADAMCKLHNTGKTSIQVTFFQNINGKYVRITNAKLEEATK